MKTIEKLSEINLDIEKSVRKLESALYKFVKEKGGFIYFNVEKDETWPECPIVRLIDIRNIGSRYKLEPAHEHLVHALKTDNGDVMFFASKFHETYNETYTKDEIFNTPFSDDRWHSLMFGEDTIYYDTLSRIYTYLEVYYDELFGE